MTTATIVLPRHKTLDASTRLPMDGVIDLTAFDEPAQLPPDMAWQDRGVCSQADPEVFFPEKGGSTLDAKRICRTCPVRQECLAYALATRQRFGIWGGLSERERHHLLKTSTDRTESAA